MEGVILFVDDKVHSCGVKDGEHFQEPENKLFVALKDDYPVLGVCSLDFARQAVKSIGSFKAIILDWNFDEDELGLDDDATTKFITRGSVRTQRTLNFLRENEFYSLVYIYSDEDVESLYGDELREIFKDRIIFRKKIELTNTGEAKKKILEDLLEWKDSNENLSIPLSWVSAINRSTQEIFKELANTDPDWIKEVYGSAKSDNLVPSLFVIEIFQHLLTENLVQNKELVESIKNFSENNNEVGIKNGEESATKENKDFAKPSEDEIVKDEQVNRKTFSETKEQSSAKLFNRIFYSKLAVDSPIMTGDICIIDENKFGIIISPECDIAGISKDAEREFDLLVFGKDSFVNYLQKTHTYTKENFGETKPKVIDTIGKVFNQEEPKIHALPSFPTEAEFNKSVIINFSYDCKKIASQKVNGLKREFKLNSPFIQQLRQRYLSYLGRVGVPRLPISVRDFNLK